MSATETHWKGVREHIQSLECYTLEHTIELLLTTFPYEDFFGKGKNRTLYKSDPVLYASVLKHSEVLEEKLSEQGTYYGSYNLKHRLKFLVECNADIENLRCSCGRTYNWTRYCRQCPEPKKTFLGKKHSDETRRKIRLSTLDYLESVKGQVIPRYNKSSIELIEQYGAEHGYNFRHAENGGEFRVPGLGYFVDAYDQENNVVLEIDEIQHFNNGELRPEDVRRQKEIEEHLNCTFIRIRV